MVLIDVGALDLRHRDKVFSEQSAIIGTDTSNFGQTLITVEKELLSLLFKLLALSGQHVSKTLFFVFQKFIFSSDYLILRAILKAPS